MENNRLLQILQRTVSENEIDKLSAHTLPHISEFNRSVILEMDHIVLCLSLFYMPQTAASTGNGSLYYFTGQQSNNILLPYEICKS